jgi:hypothetical protein
MPIVPTDQFNATVECWIMDRPTQPTSTNYLQSEHIHTCTTMSKHPCVVCPGWGKPFSKGHSLSQHFVWNPACKATSTRLSSVSTATQDLCTSGLANGCSTTHNHNHTDRSMLHGSMDSRSNDYPGDNLFINNNNPFIGPPKALADAKL